MSSRPARLSTFIRPGSDEPRRKETIVMIEMAGCHHEPLRGKDNIKTKTARWGTALESLLGHFLKRKTGEPLLPGNALRKNFYKEIRHRLP